MHWVLEAYGVLWDFKGDRDGLGTFKDTVLSSMVLFSWFAL